MGCALFFSGALSRISILATPLFVMMLTSRIKKENFNLIKWSSKRRRRIYNLIARDRVICAHLLKVKLISTLRSLRVPVNNFSWKIFMNLARGIHQVESWGRDQRESPRRLQFFIWRYRWGSLDYLRFLYWYRRQRSETSSSFSFSPEEKSTELFHKNSYPSSTQRSHFQFCVCRFPSFLCYPSLLHKDQKCILWRGRDEIIQKKRNHYNEINNLHQRTKKKATVLLYNEITKRP